jgi:hypothetical protein
MLKKKLKTIKVKVFVLYIVFSFSIQGVYSSLILKTSFNYIKYILDSKIKMYKIKSYT